MLRLQFSSSLPHRITEQIPLPLAMCTYQIRHQTVILQEKILKCQLFLPLQNLRNHFSIV